MENQINQINQFTLVSGYINIESIESSSNPDNINQREHTFSIYKERGQKLINIPIKKIIFIDARYIDQFEGNAFSRLIPITLEEMDIYPYYQEILLQMHSQFKISILSPNSKKETALFHIIQIAKTEFIKKAIALDTLGTIDKSDKPDKLDTSAKNIYAWIDFGILKIFKDTIEFETAIMNIPHMLDNIKPNTIKIPGCWKLNTADINNDFARVNWYFSGGFFIGYKDILLEFEKMVKKELKCILEDKKLTFEVNIWFRIWRKGFGQLDWYYGNHDVGLVRFG
jgi:hypothetical protein